MDVNSVISNTIQKLNSYKSVDSISPVVELDMNAETSASGGREAARENYSSFVNTLNKAAAKVDERVSFDFHKASNRIIMRVTDPSTNEVLKQVPSKDMVELLEDINKMVGLIIDEKR